MIVLVEDAPVAAPAPGPGSRRSSAAAPRAPTSQSVTGYYETRSPDFVSKDGDSTYLAVSLKPTDDKEWQEAGAEIADELAGRPGVTVGGAAVAQEQVNKQVEKDLRMAEMLAFPLLFLLSLLFFRSLVAALLPLMIGGLAIVGTFLVLRIASEFGSISIFALNLTTGLGLGLAIDYSLFVVSRYREEIAKDGPGPGGDAARARDGRAHRLLLLADRRRGARLAARLPAALPLLDGARRRAGGAARGADLADRAAGRAGPARHRGSTRSRRASCSAAPRPTRGPTSRASGTGSRASSCAGRSPVATLSALLLIVLGMPFFGIKFNTVDPTVLPEGASARQADDTVSAEFPPYRETPIWSSSKAARRRRRRRSRPGAPGRRRRRGPPAAAAAAATYRDPGDLQPTLRLRGEPGRR